MSSASSSCLTLPFGSPGPERRCAVHGDAAAAGLCTPQRPAGKSQPVFGLAMRTPEPTRRNLTTPPAGPTLVQSKFHEEVHAALIKRCPRMLSAALLRTHSCCADHCVHEAVRYQHVAALDFLLELGAPEFDEPCHGRRPLHFAVEASLIRGDAGYNMADRLLRRGAKPNACSGDELSCAEPPLHEAAKLGNASMVALLLAYGAELSSTSAAGEAPLHRVGRYGAVLLRADGGHAEVARLLIQRGANPFQRDGVGRTPLQHASDAGLKEILSRAEHLCNKHALVVALRGRGGGPWLSYLELPDIAAVVGIFL